MKDLDAGFAQLFVPTLLTERGKARRGEVRLDWVYSFDCFLIATGV
jgi:hypothetical protein